MKELVKSVGIVVAGVVLSYGLFWAFSKAMGPKQDELTEEVVDG